MRLLPRLVAIALVCSPLFVGCGAEQVVPTDPLVRARHAAEGSQDGEVLGRWLFSELVAPGGEPTQANKARAALDALSAHPHGIYASMGRAVDDDAHGRLVAAAGDYIDAVDAARDDEGPEASMLGWYAANRLVALRESVPRLWDKAKPVVERAITEPGRIGFRARNELVDYWVAEESSTMADASWETLTRQRSGCATEAHFAGPFGRLAPMDTTHHFDAEDPGPWPQVFAKDPSRLVAPRVYAAKLSGCRLSTSEPTDAGIYYIETFVSVDDARDMIVLVEGATSVFVDDTEVLHRDPDEWGAWPRFGAKIHVKAGRHRVLARLAGTETTVRILDERGRPLGGATSADPAPGYQHAPPAVLDDPNPLAPFLEDLGVPGRLDHALGSVLGGAPGRGAFAKVDPNDPLVRFIGATLAHVDGQDDLASVIVEPLVRDSAKATGISLSLAATLIEGDPIFTPNDARDLALDLRTRATQKDSLLWYPRLWLALDAADKQGVTDVLPKLTDLASQFAEVPGIIRGLASVYARLGWKAEHATTIFEAAKRFPDDPDVLRAELSLLDEQGQFAQADAVVARLRVLDPRGLIDVERAIRRGDYDGAVAALETAKQHPQGGNSEDQAIETRIEDILTRAGKDKETFALLEKALAKDPKSEKARIALADARFAAGNKGALRSALVDAIEKGAETDSLRDAIELVEGTSELSAYRMDGLATIREYETSGAAARGLASAAEAQPSATAPNGQVPETKPHGAAARVLDYSALWIRADGSARMLEHEIFHMQSRDAIAREAEQPLPQGELLHLRTVKPDGTIYEPEFIKGKPTVTMPHLDVGDYIERETITPLPGDGAGGKRFLSPRWLFAEENVDFYRSEFVIVSPMDRPLDIETTGDVPAPKMKEDGALVTRVYRVDHSPAVPEERFRAPVEEYLPSVRVGWGVNQADMLSRFVDLASARTPRDPRLVRIAETILANGKKGGEATAEIKKLSNDEKARRIYRWVAANVQEGKESDPRKVVTGKSGSRADAFIYLARIAGVDAERALVVDRLAPPPRGPMSEAEMFQTAVVAVPLTATLGTSAKYRWMVVGDKFAPYGFLPSSLRNQPAVLLVAGAPRTTTSAEGAEDGIDDVGDATLAPDGSATLSLDESYSGRNAIGLRSDLSTIPESNLKEVIESNLLSRILPGARLVSVEVKNLEDLDAPLTLSMKMEMSTFAVPGPSGLRLPPPFAPDLSALALLPSRQTPLFISDRMTMSHRVKLRVHLPKGAKATLPAASSKSDAPSLLYEVNDHLEGDTLVLERKVELPAGRIKPDDYPAFAKLVRDANQAFSHDIAIQK